MFFLNKESQKKLNMLCLTEINSLSVFFFLIDRILAVDLYGCIS